MYTHTKYNRTILHYTIRTGDAAHAFPPDLGAGLNAALEDVYDLHRAILHIRATTTDTTTIPTTTNTDTDNGVSGTGTGSGIDNLPRILATYQNQRLPEIKGLCETCQIAFPYQYRQSIFWYYMYIINIVTRLMLNRIAPALFSPSAMSMCQDHRLTWVQVITYAHRTTRNIMLCSVGVIVLVAVPFILA